MVLKLNARTILIVVVLIAALFLALGAVSIAGWEYSNSNDFCANACHQVHPQEPYAHQLSQHVNVNCVECHIGRMGFLESAIEKSGHVTHAWSLLVGYERPTHAKSLQSAENSCQNCHPSTTHRNNSLRVKNKYEQDRENSESKIMLTMRLVGREFGDEERLGVNWHASGAVRYIADDPHSMNISVVEASLPDGSMRVYRDVTNPPADGGSTDSNTFRTMDCLSCHNRVGHAFPSPEDVVDSALASGLINSDLPFIKKRVMQLVDQNVESEEQARTLVEQAWNEYRKEFPEVVDGLPGNPLDAQRYQAERQQWFIDLMVRSQHLEAEGIDWTSFPDQNGHRDAPGCFRCHNGRLQSAEGVPIPVNCTNCHSIPLVTTDSEIPAYYLEIMDMRVPENHLNPAFMSVHMELAEDSCSSCHGDIEYGDDNQSHCSNSGCHSEYWEHLDFDALRTSGDLPGND